MFCEVGIRYYSGSQIYYRGAKLIVEVKKEVKAMQWEFIVALVITIPVILVPAAFVWYLNIGGVYTAIKEARERRVARQKKGKEAVTI